MKREIKFRAWNGEQMISPDYIDRKGFAFWKENSIPTTSKNIMQFTGLHDKNGVEIYEGDILGEKGRHEEDNIYVCEYISEEARYLFTSPYDGESFYYDEISDLEVIGNIHENTELLK